MYFSVMNMIQQEIWVPISGYENRYEISSFGRVKSFLTGILLKPNLTKWGYHKYWLYNGSKKDRKGMLSHRLVAIAFIPNPNGYLEVNHIDGNKLNNSISNLEWCTCKQNVQHAHRIGLVNKKVRQYNSAFKDCDVLEIRKIFAQGGITKAELARRYSVSQFAIGRVIRHESYQYLE